MKSTVFTILLFVCIHFVCWGQEEQVSPLFQDQAPLNIKLAIGIKDIKAIKSDTVYVSNVMNYRNNSGGQWDSMNVEVRARGEYRRRECYYPPLRLKMKKKDTKATVFDGNKSLKLVMPCRQVKDDGLILREFICYKMFEVISEYTFNTRLVDVVFTDENSKKVVDVQFKGFFIEDDDIVAKRHDGKVVEDLKLHPKALDDKNALRHDMFQYLIANTDWSTTFQHNAKLIQLNESKKFIPLTYDFDMSGFVDAPYAVADASLGIANVRERLYRGFCRDEAVTQEVRQEFVAHEADIMAAVKAFESSFPAKEFAGIEKYVADFFDTFKDDAKFNREIVGKCRTQ